MESAQATKPPSRYGLDANNRNAVPATFVALGGVWLDEICVPGKEVVKNVPGGTVAFATLGARLFASDKPMEIAMLVKTGRDFPLSLVDSFANWGVDLRCIVCSGQPAARGRVVYGSVASDRSFTALTAPLLTTPADLVERKHVSARSFHFFDVPAAVERQVDELERMRREKEVEGSMLVVWEPQVKSCSPATLEEHRAVAAERASVFSPNHAELGLLFTEGSTKDIVFDKATVERQAWAFMPSTPSSGRRWCIIVRCAEHGCFVLSSGPEHGTWLPAYHQQGSDKVVDPTGAGNTFLGGAAVGLLETWDFVQAAAYGSVAASFAVERVGLLVRLEELQARERLEEFRSRYGLARGGM